MKTKLILALTLSVLAALCIGQAASMGALLPELSQPRVVATSSGNASCGSRLPSGTLRFSPKIWPTWKVSSPNSPLMRPTMASNGGMCCARYVSMRSSILRSSSGMVGHVLTEKGGERSAGE